MEKESGSQPKNWMDNAIKTSQWFVSISNYQRHELIWLGETSRIVGKDYGKPKARFIRANPWSWTAGCVKGFDFQRGTSAFKRGPLSSYMLFFCFFLILFGRLSWVCFGVLLTISSLRPPPPPPSWSMGIRPKDRLSCASTACSPKMTLGHEDQWWTASFQGCWLLRFFMISGLVHFSAGCHHIYVNWNLYSPSKTKNPKAAFDLWPWKAKQLANPNTEIHVKTKPHSLDR